MRSNLGSGVREFEEWTPVNIVRYIRFLFAAACAPPPSGARAGVEHGGTAVGPYFKENTCRGGCTRW